MNGQKIDFLRFSKQGNKYFFPCKTKHRPYVTLANFPIQIGTCRIFLSHTTHLTMKPSKPYRIRFQRFLGSQKRVQKCFFRISS
ncbi:hypothetical protein [Acinetobacter baumannii]|uniref:hypothetical protein n=1 Tax=Acinetobacter baumannii TaxID=470 RepID=UPI0036F45DF0